MAPIKDLQGPLPQFQVTPAADASLTPAVEIERLIANPSYGVIFTDHMVTITWTAAKGWHDAKVTKRAPFQIDPASAVLHYSQEIFEGLKAYRAADGAISTFRIEENAKRLNESARRMVMPTLPEPLFLEAVERLVQQDQAWIPGGDGSLYLRPFMFATESFLGVRPSSEYVFCVIASPVGSYFKSGTQAIKVWVSDQFSRAANGGTGAAKTGGNYAGSLIAQKQASSEGCDQALFLDARDHRWLEELGGMNLFLVMKDGALVTPPLGAILKGITRASVMELARARGMTALEQAYSIDQLVADAKSGRLKEAFACGTAAVIMPIGAFRYHGEDLPIADGAEGETTRSLRAELTDIQRGRRQDRFGWRRVIAT